MGIVLDDQENRIAGLKQQPVVDNDLRLLC
jgi:hypothetical protein